MLKYHFLKYQNDIFVQNENLTLGVIFCRGQREEIFDTKIIY